MGPPPQGPRRGRRRRRTALLAAGLAAGVGLNLLRPGGGPALGAVLWTDRDAGAAAGISSSQGPGPGPGRSNPRRTQAKEERPLRQEEEEEEEEDARSRASGGGAPAATTTRAVYVLPRVAPGAGRLGELRHFVLDAVRRSSRLHDTDDPDDLGAAWVVELVRCKCEEFLPLVRGSMERRTEALRRSSSGTGIGGAAAGWRNGTAPGWDVYMLDYHDQGYARAPDCARELVRVLGDPSHVHYATRRQIRDKRLADATSLGDPDQPFGPLGVPIDWATHRGGILGHVEGVPRVLRYGVRTDLVDYVEGHYNLSLYEDLDDGVGGAGTQDGREHPRGPFVDLPAMHRPVDVAHMWTPGSDKRHGLHRTGIALALRDMRDRPPPEGWSRNVTMELDPTGRRAKFGRNDVQPSYVARLMESKIVVVSQRDIWEDHYRLMEALVCGGMVMTDPMSSLPKYLEDGVSVVVYRSLSELRDKVWHYLRNGEERTAIARRGHRIALDHHRSWHGLERILFGNWSDPLSRR